MKNAISNQSTAVPRDVFVDALRYWERGRVVYNLVLAAVVVGWVWLSWPHFREAMSLVNLGRLLVLAAIANVFYCAAYFVDLPMQHTTLQATWRRWRWCLWLVGMLFALLLTNYWIADEIYPYV